VIPIREEWFHILLWFYDLHIYLLLVLQDLLAFCSGSLTSLRKQWLSMTITFENDHHVIIYTLDKIIAWASSTQQILVSHCIWWLASVPGFDERWIALIDMLQWRAKVRLEDSPAPVITQGITYSAHAISMTAKNISEDHRAEQILDCSEHFVTQSEYSWYQLRHGRINPLPHT
jgi:hypothetical protein